MSDTPDPASPSARALRRAPRPERQRPILPGHPREPDDQQDAIQVDPVLWSFENLARHYECFDFTKVKPTGTFYAKYSPHLGKVLYAIPGGRWVLMYIDGALSGDQQPDKLLDGMLLEFDDIEVSPAFAAAWIYANDQRPPGELTAALARVTTNPMLDERVRAYYVKCKARDAELAKSCRGSQTEQADRLDDHGWITGTRRELTQALGKHKKYPDYLERLEEKGELEFRRNKNRSFSIKMTDRALGEQIQAQVDQGRDGTRPNP